MLQVWSVVPGLGHPRSAPEIRARAGRGWRRIRGTEWAAAAAEKADHPATDGSRSDRHSPDADGERERALQDPSHHGGRNLCRAGEEDDDHGDVGEHSGYEAGGGPGSSGDTGPQQTCAWTGRHHGRLPPAILHDLSARRERLETMVEVACRWSRKFAIRQVEEMLAATFPEIEADFRKAVAFGVARGTQPTSTTLPSSTTSTSPPQRTAGPPAPVNPTSGGDADPRHYPEAGRGIFLDTPLASGDAMIGEDELLHLLGDWGETVAGISAAYEDITPPGEADVGENGGAD